MTYYELLILLAPLVFAFSKRYKSTVAALVISAGAVIAASAAVMTLTVGHCPYMPTIDRVSSIFILAIAIVGTASSVYAIGITKKSIETKKSTQISLHFFCLVVLFYSMIGVLLATKVYEFLLWWELMTLSSFILVIFEASRREVLHAGISYLVLMHIAFFFLIGGFSTTATNQMWNTPTITMWFMFLVGFGLKSALFPLHIWLPVTYLNTPPHVTAMMSGVMINMGVYGIIRTALVTDNPYAMGLILFSVGAISGLFGIIKAAMHTGLKRLLAYSSIENMGIITMAIGIGTIGRAVESDTLAACGYGGALLHTINHSVYKSLLFMTAGSVEKMSGQSDLNRMGGLLRKMPITGGAFAVGALAICAIPPLSGFFSEFTIFTALFEMIATRSQPIIGILGVVILALIAGLAILTFSKAFSMTFLGQARSCAVRDAGEGDTLMTAGYILPVAAIIIGGLLFPTLLFDPSSEILDTMVTIEIVMGVALGIVIALWIFRAILQRQAAISTQPTWGCAFASPNKDMQYTSSSMSRELQNTVSTKTVGLTITETFPTAHSFATEHTDRANRVITQTSQRMLHRWTARLAFLQTGRTNHYILHALLFFVLILLLSITGAI